MHTLRFDELIDYDPGLAGITVPVALELDRCRVELEAKLDTGASECVVSRRYGVQLGLDIEKGLPLPIMTVTGRFVAYRHRVTLYVLEYQFDVGVCFAADEAFDRNVLGRHGFLDRVNVGIVDYEGKLYLGRYGDA